MYKISITKRAEKDLKNLERATKNRIVTAISDLKNDARPLGCRKIQSEAGVWRVRVGDWRIGYFIDDVKQEINIIRIAHVKNFTNELRFTYQQSTSAIIIHHRDARYFNVE